MNDVGSARFSAMRISRTPVLLSLACLNMSAASFDCKKATTAVEKKICTNNELSVLDERLAGYYAAASESLERAAPCLKTDQQQWLRNVRNRCGDEACLRRAYVERLSELDPLTPGVVSIRNMELPRVRSLVWIIPPAEDRIAFPTVQNAPPLEVAGRISASEDGPVVQDGKRTAVLTPLSNGVSARTAGALETIIKASKPPDRYLVRGYAAQRDRHLEVFEPSQCVYIYRLP